MSNSVKALIVAGAIGILVVLLAVFSYIGNYNYGNSAEHGLNAAVDNAQTVYSNAAQIIMESARVPEMAKDHVKEVVIAAMEGRYGENGSQAMFQAMSENYPGTLDMTIYTRIQDQIESQRMNFTAVQQQVIDRRTTYEIALGSFWSGFWLARAGYPKIDLDDPKYHPVVNAQTTRSFSTGVDEGFKF